MKALLIGSISVLADTSELQRNAYNDAFHEAGLDWYWSRGDYRAMLAASGGTNRIAEFAERCGEQADVEALHAHKTVIFLAMMRREVFRMRPLVARALADARRSGIRIGLVSGTSSASIRALLDNFGGAETLGIALVTSEDLGLPPKPDPALYTYALRRLGVAAQDAVAIEDNVPGVRAAETAGVTCYAYPNENTMLHDFGNVPRLQAWLSSQVA